MQDRGEPKAAVEPPTTSETVIEDKAPPTMDNHGGKLTPVTHGPLDMLSVVATAILLLSPISALLYGFGMSTKAPSAFRTAVKTMAVGFIAAISTLALVIGWSGGMSAEAQLAWSLLCAGFWLCAVGDAFLAGDPKRWLPPGLVSFLLGHLAFIALFLTSTATQTSGLVLVLAGAVVALVGGLMLRWLWDGLGEMRGPVIAYVVVIVMMVGAALGHWRDNIAWPIGALMFMASDAILAGELFKGAKLFGSPRLTAWAIWFLYYGAQVAFLVGMIGYVVKV